MKSYGRHETITSNCDTTVRFTPNDLETAEEISRQIGQTSVRHEHRTQADGGGSVSEPEVGRPLMTADEVRRMSVKEVLIFARGQRPIRAPLLKYHEQRVLQTAGGNQTTRHLATARLPRRPPTAGGRKNRTSLSASQRQGAGARSARQAAASAAESKLGLISHYAAEAAARERRRGMRPRICGVPDRRRNKSV